MTKKRPGSYNIPMKSDRQSKIIELIGKYPIDTQKALTIYLKEAGFEVTQATVSRDIAQLGIKKVADKGVIKYVYTPAVSSDDEKYIRALRDGYISCAKAGTLVVIRTTSGMAMSVALALDNMDLPEIIGTVAGDDTIMCAAESESKAEALLNKINRIV